MAGVRGGHKGEQRIEDRIDVARAAGLFALMDMPGEVEPGTVLPPLAHFIYFWDTARQSDLGDDGHAAVGGHLPDTGLPLRMWAGGRFAFHAPFKAGVQANRVSRVTGLQRKTGRSGELAFVTVRHMIHQAGRLVLTEDQDIVYRSDTSERPEPPTTDARFEEALPIRFDAAKLFRYSALTFNAHRIHYDHPYCRVHGYPGLVVHGPLLATVLAMVAADRLGSLKTFSFRATAPLFGGEPARICRDGRKLWIEGPERRLCMTADASA